MTRDHGPDFAEIKEAMLGRLDALVRQLAPGGKIMGAYYMPKNPTRADKKAGSFWIRVRGGGLGAWRDDATGDKGDLFKLVQYCLGHTDMKETRAWCLAWLGWSGGRAPQMTKQKRVELLKRDKARQRAEDETRRREGAEKSNKALAWWLSANVRILSTPIDLYLKSRGIELIRFSALPGAIRYLPDCEHVDSDGVVTEWPVMMTAMCDANGHVRAVHRTFLAADGLGKAPVVPVKKIWPAYSGCMIRLAKGAGNHTPEVAGRKNISAPLLVCEGIEDALTFALAEPDLRVWAAGTLGNLANIPKLDCISRLIVPRDNDPSDSQASALFDKIITTLEARFGDVRVPHSFAGKDANDLLRA